MSNPPFISLDGLDGAGKSTQCRLLADWLRTRGLDVVQCADPGGTEIGDVLRTLLLEHRGHMTLPCEALLFMASRAQLVAEVIRPALAAGTAVVCDRFLLANVVYQGHAGGLDPQKLWDLGLLATGGLEPDLIFVLDLPIDVAQSRRKAQADRMERRDGAFFSKVRDGFVAEARRRPERIRVVDAAQPVDRIQETMRAVIASWLDR
ncbi:MAG: dTMP kinase [Gemmataceae bacterium]|nr:dTMP kinase [Gemmataceae bacterium]